MQVDVHHVNPHIAGADFAEQRVQIRAVAINQAAFGVDDVGDVAEMRFKQAERVRIRDHNCGHVFRHRRRHRRRIKATIRAGRNRRDVVAGKRAACRVRAVRGIGNQHLFARIPLLFQIRPNHHHAGQFAVRSGGGLQRGAGEAGDFAQRALQFPHQPDRALRQCLRRVRMQPGESIERGGLFVHFRVIFHRA